jgi:hypothetical protein
MPNTPVYEWTDAHSTWLVETVAAFNMKTIPWKDIAESFCERFFPMVVTRKYIRERYINYDSPNVTPLDLTPSHKALLHVMVARVVTAPNAPKQLWSVISQQFPDSIDGKRYSENKMKNHFNAYMQSLMSRCDANGNISRSDKIIIEEKWGLESLSAWLSISQTTWWNSRLVKNPRLKMVNMMRKKQSRLADIPKKFGDLSDAMLDFFN